MVQTKLLVQRHFVQIATIVLKMVESTSQRLSLHKTLATMHVVERLLQREAEHRLNLNRLEPHQLTNEVALNTRQVQPVQIPGNLDGVGLTSHEVPHEGVERNVFGFLTIVRHRRVVIDWIAIRVEALLEGVKLLVEEQVGQRRQVNDLEVRVRGWRGGAVQLRAVGNLEESFHCSVSC